MPATIGIAETPLSRAWPAPTACDTLPDGAVPPWFFSAEASKLEAPRAHTAPDGRNRIRNRLRSGERVVIALSMIFSLTLSPWLSRSVASCLPTPHR